MTRNVEARSFRRARSSVVTAICALLLTIFVPIATWAAPYAAYVIDARTGQVLYENNSNTRLYPASLTKMMTLYITFGAIERGEISLDTMVTVSAHAAGQAPSRLGLRPGQKIALRYLIRGAAIKSANDAATAICEAVGGSEQGFARRMNATAKALGMTRSTFRNCNGLTAEGHLSTAHDLTILGRHLFYDFPQYYGIFSRRTADAGVAQVASTNRRFLNAYDGADGIKTGYTVAAGFNLTASAQRGDKRIIATILGGKSTADRNARMAQLLDMGFSKAPDNVATRKPLPPVLTADATALPTDRNTGPVLDTGDEGEDSVAAAVAQDVAGDGAAPPAGKTLRVVLAIAQSPRPKGRPAPVDTAGAVLVADAAPESTPAPVPALTPEAPAGPVFVQTAAPQPETAALAAAIRAEGGPDVIAEPTDAPSAAFLATVPPTPKPADMLAAADPVAAQSDTSGVHPMPRPAALSGSAAGTAGSSADPTASAIAAAVAEAVAGDQSEVAVAPAEADGVPGQTVVAAPDATASPIAIADVAAALPSDKAADKAPGNDGGEIVLASVAPSDTVPLQPGEIVSRASTSGGQQYAINVGRYPSRYEAERVLLQTGLLEVSMLDEAPRKVLQRKAGFDAYFVGLSQQTAELACMRLQARATDCSVVGPEG